MNQRQLLAGVIGCIAVVGVFVGSLVWVNSTTHCSPGSVCDVPVYAGIGVGILLAPIVWFSAVWVTVVLTRPPGQPSWITVLPPRPSGQRSRWRNPLGGPPGSLLLKLAMFATLPVVLIVATAGFLGARHGSSTLWGALAVGISVAVMVWSFKNSHEPFMSRFLAPIAFYLPPLLLAGFVLSILGNLAWTPLTISLVALVAAVSNVFFAPFFFTMGAALDMWESL